MSFLCILITKIMALMSFMRILITQVMPFNLIYAFFH